jgi:hypothetical protein
MSFVFFEYCEIIDGYIQKTLTHLFPVQDVSAGNYDVRLAAELCGEKWKSTEFSHICCIINPGQVIRAQGSFPTQIIVIMHFFIYMPSSAANC